MATAKKVLTNVNDEIVIDIPTDQSGAIGVQYGAGGAGTIVVEGTIDSTTWLALKIINVTTKVDADNLAASGIGSVEVYALEKVRVRKTVAGPGDVTVTISLAN